MYRIVRLRVREFKIHRGGKGKMAIAQLERTPSTIIENGKASKFFCELNKNMPNQDFWKECKRLRESADNSVADAADALIAKRLNRR